MASGNSWHVFGLKEWLLTSSQNLYYRRTRRLDVPLITEIQLLPENQSPPSIPWPGTWTKVSLSIRDGVRGEPPMYLWYKTGKTARELSAEEKRNDLITELDVLYGDDRPWYGFTKLEPSVTIPKAHRVEDEWLTYRKGVKRMYLSVYCIVPH